MKVTTVHSALIATLFAVQILMIFITWESLDLIIALSKNQALLSAIINVLAEAHN